MPGEKSTTEFVCFILGHFISWQHILIICSFFNTTSYLHAKYECETSSELQRTKIQVEIGKLVQGIDNRTVKFNLDFTIVFSLYTNKGTLAKYLSVYVQL